MKNDSEKHVGFMTGSPKLAAYFSKGTANTSGVVSTTARAASSAGRKEKGREGECECEGGREKESKEREGGREE